MPTRPIDRTQQQRAFVDTEPSPQNLRAIWDAIRSIKTQQATADDTITKQAATLGSIEGQLQDVDDRLRQALITAGKETGTGTTNEGTEEGDANCDELATDHPDHVDVVEAVIADLVAHGVDLSGPCGSFAVVNEVVKWLRPSEPDIGLIAKGGNNCMGYSTDALMYKDGVVFDILSDAENAPPTGADPQWGFAGCRDEGDWRDPV